MNENRKSILAGIIMVIAFFALLFGIGSGFSMMSLRSVAGNTVAEAYYNYMGGFVVAMSIFMFLILIIISVILLHTENHIIANYHHNDSKTYCTECDSPVSDNAKFCSNCGEKFDD